MVMTKIYESESAMCLAFVERAREAGWDVYPETGKCDLLLIASDKVTTTNAKLGDQLAIEAKLHCNVEVLHQAMPKEWGFAGPNFHAILVPFATGEFLSVARRLGILVFEASKKVHRAYRVYERVPMVSDLLRYLPESYRVYYDEPVWKPDAALWTTPGVKSPTKISPWKVAAIRMCLYALEKEFVTLADFRERKINIDRWRGAGWIVSTGEKIGHMMKYRFDENSRIPPPHKQYPELTEQLRKDHEDSVKEYRKRPGR